VSSNWITPVVVTPAPAPANAATAEFYAAVATAQAVVAGPDAVVWTATPTPIFDIPTVYPTFTPTPGYEPVPQALVGKIAFLSDRAGNPHKTGQKPRAYILDPSTGNVSLLSNRSAYDMALLRDNFSPDLRFRAYVEDFLRFDGERVPGLYFHDKEYDATEQVTQLGAGIAYDPAWSPAREQIAYISTETGNDEIWVVNRDGTGLRQLTNEPNWDKSPSWSPDGARIIFWSNRTGRAQLWITNADGSDQYILNPSPYNDWNPVWIKYPGLPPLIPEAIPSPPPVFVEFD
jgi:TolB protein